MFWQNLALTLLLLFSAVSGVAAERSSDGHADLDYFGKYEAGIRKYMQFVEQAHLDSSHLKKNIMQLISEGNYTQVYGELKYVLERIPNHPRALQIAGLVSRLTNKQAVAVGYFEKALSLYPQYAITHAQYGSFLMEIGNLDAGIEKVKQATEIDPKFAPGHALLAKAYVKKGNYDLARESEQKARELGYQGPISEKTGNK